MHILRNFDDLILIKKPVVLTLGNFDGVHKGHQAVLKELQRYKNEIGAESVVLTFSNHPATILHNHPIKLLTTLPHRLNLLKEAGADRVFLLPFTKETARETAEDFLGKILTRCALKALVLGFDATLGKEKKGGKEELSSFAAKHSFQLDYISPITVEGKKVSSSHIRREIEAGNLAAAIPLLGRPFSLYQTIQTGLGLAKKLGFPTLNFNVDSLCIPPLGIYVVEVIQRGVHYRGVANLGTAPTVRTDNCPLLEVYLLEGKDSTQPDLPYEVIYRHYVRPEKKFDTLDALKEQITHDVEFAKAYNFSTN